MDSLYGTCPLRLTCIDDMLRAFPGRQEVRAWLKGAPVFAKGVDNANRAIRYQGFAEPDNASTDYRHNDKGDDACRCAPRHEEGDRREENEANQQTDKPQPAVGARIVEHHTLQDSHCQRDQAHCQEFSRRRVMAYRKKEQCKQKGDNGEEQWDEDERKLPGQQAQSFHTAGSHACLFLGRRVVDCFKERLQDGGIDLLPLRGWRRSRFPGFWHTCSASLSNRM